MNNYVGEAFLDKLYQNLYMSDEVQRTIVNGDKRAVAINRYMNRIQNIHQMATTDHKKNLLFRLYCNKYVVNEKYINNHPNKEEIIDAQKKSLKAWIDYLSDYTTSYPVWARYWAFQGMLKMGAFNNSSGIYMTRSKKTIAPFISVNPEIVGKAIEFIVKSIYSENIPDNITDYLSKNDSFSTIYTFFEKKYKHDIRKTSASNDGIWIKYNQGSREDAIKLVKSLENKNTHWCTAVEMNGINQVCGPYSGAPDGGDFYVYYTRDENGKYSIPRIAIRLVNNNEIGEIRGVASGQNLEYEMIDVLKDKLNSLTFVEKEGINESIRIIDDLNELDIINKKTDNNEELTKQELTDLYTKEFGFGYDNDPRAIEILKKRDFAKDYEDMPNEFGKLSMIICGHLKPGSIKQKEIMLDAVTMDGFALEYASEYLKDDIELVMAAVLVDGCALQFASERLKDNEDIVVQAISENALAYKYASTRLKNDINIAIMAVRKRPEMYLYVPENIKNNPIFLLSVKIDENSQGKKRS